MPNNNPHYQDPLPSAFDDFYLVLLDKGPNRAEPQTNEEREHLHQQQLAHLAFLKQLWEDGISIGAGPFTDDEGGGLILIRANGRTQEDVWALLNGDAHLRSGRLAARVRPFVVPKGIL